MNGAEFNSFRFKNKRNFVNVKPLNVMLAAQFPKRQKLTQGSEND